MQHTSTSEFAEEILTSIRFCMHAHQQHPKSGDDTVRFWDRNTPYLIHPTWCAMTLLTETTLNETLRRSGYQALLWHDILEDTKIDRLPDNTSEIVVRYVNDMTFDSFSDEVSAIWSKDKETRLLKLYDKVSNLLDGTWMGEEKWYRYASYTLELSDDVKSNFGMLNIINLSCA